MDITGRTFLALLSGIAAGAALGILFAPDRGSETRRKIADSTRRMADNIKDTAVQGKHAVENLTDKLYNRGEEAVNQAKTEADKFKTNVKQSI